MSEVENSIDKDEILIRIFYHPDHTDALGNIKSSAIPSEDLKSRGVSVDRKKHANKSYIENNINNSVARKEGRNLATFGLIKHEVILNIHDTTNISALHVRADPIENNPAHALILTRSNNYPPSVIKKLRKELIDAFNFVKTLEEAID